MLVKVKKIDNADLGFGLFCSRDSIAKNTILCHYSGTPIYCFDPNGDFLRPRPVGCNIICCDHERGIYLDVSSSPEVGEEGCESSCARFANSSHPLLPAPYNEANAILICCPENVECYLSSLKILRKGDQILVDYHEQLTKLGIAQSCGCHDCNVALRSRRWPAESLISQVQKQVLCVPQLLSVLSVSCISFTLCAH